MSDGAPRRPAWTDALVERVGALLAAAQGRRQARCLSVEQVRACVDRAAASPLGFAWVDGGQSGDPRGATTVCLAVAADAGVTVGVAAARAQDATPARAWKELTRWERHDEALNRAEVLAWARRAGADRLGVPWAPVSGPRGEAALLEAVRQRPFDDAPRLVYADWLAERGEPRGELISVQCTLARLAPDDPQAPGLRAREAELLAAHSGRWLGAVPPGVVARFERGFVGMLKVQQPEAVAQLDALMAAEAVWRVVLDCRVPTSLVVAPWLPQLRSLEQRGSGGLTPALLRELLATPALAGLEALSLRDQPSLGDEGVRVLVERGGAVFKRLEQLQLDEARLTTAQVGSLAGARWVRGLRVLSLAHNEGVGPEGARLLAGALTQAHTLRLDRVRLGDEGARALASAPRLGTVGWLSVERNRLTNAGAQALLESRTLTSLRRLAVGGNGIGRHLRRRLEARFLAGEGRAE